VAEFKARLLAVTGEGSPRAIDLLEPVSFAGRVTESDLEEWVVERPELVGEDLLVLGRQLREFEEDLDRLDVLAVDRDGELVLIELKVSSDFRVTDLQALAYAGAYASRQGVQMAKTLQRTLLRSDPAATLEDAKQRIAAFLELDSFDEWEPSQHVRIKLIAPGFPKRVLRTVKWLGDVYGVRVEEILARLFEAGNERDVRHHLSFERLLPLAGDEEFDLTVRDRENRRRKENLSRRRPDVVPVLLAEGHLKDGQRLWITKKALPVYARAAYDPADVAFQVTLDASGDQPKFAWQPSAEAPLEVVSPSTVIYRVLRHLFPDRDGGRRYLGVGRRFATAPDGPTLKEIALEHGLWAADAAEEPEETAELAG
jgi:hypothetical protein